MGSGDVAQQYSLKSDDSHVESPLHDLNTVGASPGDIEEIGDVGRDATTEDGFNNGDENNSVGCLNESYHNSIPVASGVEEHRSGLVYADCSSRCPYHILTTDDIAPIENARARFLQLIVDHFINQHLINAEYPSESEHGNIKPNKRKLRESHQEGDPSFALPLMYVANLYETLVHDVNARLVSLDGIRDKTIGVALEAAGGLYRKLANKFPRTGSSCTFKRRELATSLETRTRFPELVMQEEKRVRFVVVNGLEIAEKPSNMTSEDSEWFKRLTGRNEVSVCARDYKFYSPRHKHRRLASPLDSNITALPVRVINDRVYASTTVYACADGPSTLSAVSGFRSANDPSLSKQHMEAISSEGHYHSFQQTHHRTPTQFSRTNESPDSSHLSEIPNVHCSEVISGQVSSIQSLSESGSPAGGRLNLMPTNPAKFCDQCGTSFSRESSRYCSECGAKRNTKQLVVKMTQEMQLWVRKAASEGRTCGCSGQLATGLTRCSAKRLIAVERHRETTGRFAAARKSRGQEFWTAAN